MTLQQLIQKSGFDLNSLAIQNKINLNKIEKLDNGYYCGTWYCFSTLSGEKIKNSYVPSGFGI